MNGDREFELTWLRRLSRALDTYCSPEDAAFVMEGTAPVADGTPADAPPRTGALMERLAGTVGTDRAREVMTACACRYPVDGLEQARLEWERSGDVDRVLEVLQAGFEGFLREGMGLSDREVGFVVSRNMGLAGIRVKDTIVATKIPKSGILKEYIAETDPEKRRGMYCHCPMIRESLPEAEIPPLYCYCGAGFYRALWEDILGMPVEVEVLESILDGGDVCRIAIRLPSAARKGGTDLRMDRKDPEDIARRIRLDVLEMILSAGSGHPGGSFSSVEILVELYRDVMRIRPDEPDWPERDRFVLSKGHACPALYAVLARRGYFDPEELVTLRKLHSRLQGHPNMHKLPGLDASTGSLGQGLSISCGMALGLRLRGIDSRVFCLLGDGELQEGSVWEAAMTASHYGLDRLTAIVDRNRVQLDGDVSEVMEIEPLVDKWLAFGWDVVTCDGHSFPSLAKAFEHCGETPFPSVVIADTVKGRGVSFMEGTCLWHGRCPDAEEYAASVRELEGGLS